MHYNAKHRETLRRYESTPGSDFIDHYYYKRQGLDYEAESTILYKRETLTIKKEEAEDFKAYLAVILSH